MRTAESEKRRKKLIQLIHVGKGKLGMGEEAYRAFLAGICSRESAAKMTIRQLEQALKAMRDNGFTQPPAGSGRKKKAGRPPPNWNTSRGCGKNARGIKAAPRWRRS